MWHREFKRQATFIYGCHFFCLVVWRQNMWWHVEGFNASLHTSLWWAQPTSSPSGVPGYVYHVYFFCSKARHYSLPPFLLNFCVCRAVTFFSCDRPSFVLISLPICLVSCSNVFQSSRLKDLNKQGQRVWSLNQASMAHKDQLSTITKPNLKHGFIATLIYYQDWKKNSIFTLQLKLGKEVWLNVN